MAESASSSSSNDSSTTKHLSTSLRNFSDEGVHKPGVLTAMSDMSLGKESVIQFLVTSFYGNGDVEANRGWVSIVFKCRLPLIFKSHHHFNFSCIVAVRDSPSEEGGKQHFVRTFTFPYDPEVQAATAEDVLATYRIERYVSRKALLEEREVLLPDDCLHLALEVTLHTISPDDFVDYDRIVGASFEVEEDADDGDIIRLSLDSDVAARLCEASDVFRALCDAEVVENRRGYVRLRGDHVQAFRWACKILMGAKHVSFDSMDGIVVLYLFANKYQLSGVLRACRRFFGKILHVEDTWGTFDLVADRVEKITSVARLFGDDELLERVDLFLRKWRENPRAGRRNRRSENSKVDFGNVKMEYTGLSPYLYFDLGDEDDPEGQSENVSEFQFYS